MAPTGIRNIVCQIILLIFAIYGLHFVHSCHCIKVLSSVDISKYHGLKGFMTHPYNQSLILFLSDVCEGDVYHKVTVKNEVVNNSIVTLSDLDFNETDKKNMSYVEESRRYDISCFLQTIMGFHYDGNKAKATSNESHHDESHNDNNDDKNNAYSILRSIQYGYRHYKYQDLIIYKGFFDKEVYKLPRNDDLCDRDPFHVNTKTGKLYFVSWPSSKLFCLDLNLCLKHGMCKPYEIRTGNERHNEYFTSVTLDEAHNIIFLLYSNFVIEWIDGETMLPIYSYAESDFDGWVSAISIDSLDDILYVQASDTYEHTTIYAYKINYQDKTLTKISKRTFARILKWSYNPFLKSFYAIVADYKSDDATSSNPKCMLSHFSMYNDLPPLNITLPIAFDDYYPYSLGDYTNLDVNTNPNNEHFGCAYVTMFFPENGTTYLNTYC